MRVKKEKQVFPVFLFLYVCIFLMFCCVILYCVVVLKEEGHLGPCAPARESDFLVQADFRDLNPGDLIGFGARLSLALNGGNAEDGALAENMTAHDDFAIHHEGNALILARAADHLGGALGLREALLLNAQGL